VGKQLLVGLGVALNELGRGELVALDQRIDVIYGGHL
jgi:hypothetical protein